LRQVITDGEITGADPSFETFSSNQIIELVGQLLEQVGQQSFIFTEIQITYGTVCANRSQCQSIK
jgi:hypothetical protein